MTTATTTEAPFDLATHNGIITMHNPATGNHRTIRVKTQPEDARFAPGERILELLSGPDNTRDYQGFAFVNVLGDGSVRIALWRSKNTQVWRQLAAMVQFPGHYIDKFNIEYLFEGRCRVCNRLLSTPESVASGIGPVCSNRQG